MAGSMIGRTFGGRYRIVEHIGIGGMAEVYRAQDTVLGRIVAVKVMLPQYAADEEFTIRFKQEAAAAANLQNPYIVNVYDWGQDEGTYYIVMEYVRGSDLKTAIRERGAINQRKVAEIGSQACYALSVAHHMDIIHRDVKPQNIMVQPDGNVKMMDFGIARAKNAVKSKTSSVLGTAHYISPEQAQGKDLTAASDIYSLGVCMYEAITGQLPFDGEDAVSVALKQVNEQPRPLHEIYPNVDPVLEAIVLRAMEKNPNKRFGTALEMRQFLINYLSGQLRGSAGIAAVKGEPLPASPTDATQVMGQSAAAGAAGVAGAGVTTTRVMNPVQPSSNGAQGQWGSNTQASPQSGAVPMPPAGPSAQPNVYNQNQTAQPKKGGGAKKALLVLLLLTILGVGAGVGFATMNKSQVPDISGKTLEQAQDELTTAGFSIGNVTEVYSDTVESGKVISSDPAAGKQVDKGTRVSITMSKGLETVIIPDVRGQSESEAKTTLSNQGLKPVVGDPEYSTDVEKGLVIHMSPQPGETVSKGSEIQFVVSLGPDTRVVPNVIGQSQQTATTNLNNEGFEVSIYQDYSDEVAEGMVISQNPDAQVEVNKGSTVEIVVSLGRKLIEVPDVVGQTVSDAKAALTNAGFAVSETEDYSNAAIVTSQSMTGEGHYGDIVSITAQEPQPEPSSSSSSLSTSSTTPSSSNDAQEETLSTSSSTN